MKQYVLFKNGDYQQITTQMQIDECHRRGLELFEENHPKIIALLLENAKAKKLQELGAYDSSPAVNSFTIEGIEMWLSKEQRTSLTTLANACQKLGQATMQLQIKEGIFVELPTEQVLQILAMIELYAGQCYIVTQKHYNAINLLTAIEDVEAYDFTQGYPEKLKF